MAATKLIRPPAALMTWRSQLGCGGRLPHIKANPQALQAPRLPKAVRRATIAVFGWCLATSSSGFRLCRHLWSPGTCRRPIELGFLPYCSAIWPALFSLVSGARATSNFGLAGIRFLVTGLCLSLVAASLALAHLRRISTPN